MKKLLLAALAALSTIASAQETTVTFTTLLDTQYATSDVTNGGTYVPGADKYLSVHPTQVRVYSNAGAFESNLSIDGITPSGTAGFNAATASKDGIVYIVEAGGKNLWRWDSISDTTPDNVYISALKYWYGYTSTIGSDITIGFSNEVTSGPATFFTDSTPVSSASFAFKESAPIKSKMALAFNADATSAWTVADTDHFQPLLKFNKVNDEWVQDAIWQSPTYNGGLGYYSGGPTAYDNTNNIVFQLMMHTGANMLRAYDGTTGKVLGTQALVSGTYRPIRGGGAWIEPTGETGGTLWMAARGDNASNSFNMYKWTYTVEREAGVSDWALYQE